MLFKEHYIYLFNFKQLLFFLSIVLHSLKYDLENKNCKISNFKENKSEEKKE